MLIMPKNTKLKDWRPPVNGRSLACEHWKRMGAQNRQIFGVFHTPQFMPVISLLPDVRPLARL
jgi:hypothetical protein